MILYTAHSHRVIFRVFILFSIVWYSNLDINPTWKPIESIEVQVPCGILEMFYHQHHQIIAEAGPYSRGAGLLGDMSGLHVLCLVFLNVFRLHWAWQIYYHRLYISYINLKLVFSFGSLVISRLSWVQHCHGDGTSCVFLLKVNCYGNSMPPVNRCLSQPSSPTRWFRVDAFVVCTSVQNQPPWVIKRICLFDDGHDMLDSEEITAVFVWRGVCLHPIRFHAGVAFCSSWWQQTWWTKCVSKYLAYPFPMTYFSSCEIQSHTNLLPKSLNISYHFTFFNICVQPKKKIVSRHGLISGSARRRHQNQKTQLGNSSGMFVLGALANGFVFYMHIRCM